MTAFAKLLKIIISVEKKGTGAKDAEKELTGVQKAARLAGAAIATFATVQVVRAGYELAELGAQSLRTKAAFVAISGGAEEAERRLDAMRVATRGALSEQQMMASANRLMQMGLANNAEELGNLTHMATRLGAAMGKEAGPAIEEFALMLANQSIPRLDTFGISAGRTRTRILELMKANEGMTRETAFMTAVMEEGELAMGRLGEETEDAALAFERAKAKSADLKAVLGERLAPVVADLIELTLKGVDAGMKLGMTLEILGMRATGWTDAQIRAYIETESLFRGMIDLEVAAESTGRAIGALTLEESLLAERTEWTTSRIGALTQEESLAAGAAYEAAQATEAAAGAIEDAGQAADEAAPLFGGLLDNVANLGSKFADFDVSLDSSWGLMMKAAQTMGMSAEEMGKLAQATGVADESQVRATIAQYSLVEAWKEGIISGDGVVIMTGKLDEANSELALAADAAEEGQTRLADAHTANADALIGEVEYTLDYFKAQEKTTGEVEKAHGPMQALEGNTEDVAGAFARAAAQAARFRSELRELRADLALPGYNMPGPAPLPPNLPEGAGMSIGSSFGGGPSRSYTDGRSYQGGNTTVIIQDPLAAALVMEQISGELADEIAIGM